MKLPRGTKGAKMKKLVLAAVAVMASFVLQAGGAKGILIAEESFNYENKADLDGQNGGTGWAGPWFNSPLEKQRNKIKVPGLEFPGLKTSGGRLFETGKDNRSFRDIDTSRPEVAGLLETGDYKKPAFGKHGTTIWFSFIMKLAGGNAYSGLHLSDCVEPEKDSFGNKKHQRIQLGRNNKDPHYSLLRVTNGGPGPGNWYSNTLVDETVRLVVCRFDFKDPADEGWMWLDPKPGAEPEALKADVHADKISHFMFNSINAGGNAKSEVDEIRIGTTYSSVAPGK